MWTLAYLAMALGFAVLGGYNESPWLYFAALIACCISSMVLGDRVGDALDRWFDARLG